MNWVPVPRGFTCPVCVVRLACGHERILCIPAATARREHMTHCQPCRSWSCIEAAWAPR